MSKFEDGIRAGIVEKLQQLGNGVRANLNISYQFALLVWPLGHADIANYCSSADKAEMIQALEIMLEKLKQTPLHKAANIPDNLIR